MTSTDCIVVQLLNWYTMVTQVYSSVYTSDTIYSWDLQLGVQTAYESDWKRYTKKTWRRPLCRRGYSGLYWACHVAVEMVMRTEELNAPSVYLRCALASVLKGNTSVMGICMCVYVCVCVWGGGDTPNCWRISTCLDAAAVRTGATTVYSCV